MRFEAFLDPINNWVVWDTNNTSQKLGRDIFCLFQSKEQGRSARCSISYSQKLSRMGAAKLRPSYVDPRLAPIA
jgi:hypothetical protein